MSRVKFNKNQQRKFLKKIMQKTNSPSLKELSGRLNINYSTLKNYYSEQRLLPEQLFIDLIKIHNLKKPNIKIFEETWGKSKGGKISKRK